MYIRDFIDDKEWVVSVLGNHDSFHKVASTSRAHTMGLSTDKYAGVFVDESNGTHPRFPMDTLDNVDLGAMYLCSGRTNLTKSASSQVARNLIEGYFGFNVEPPEEIKKLAEGAPSFSNFMRIKSAEIPFCRKAKQLDTYDDYAVKLASGGNYLPVHDAQDVKRAVQWFEDNVNDIPVMHKKAFAEGIQEKADNYQVSTDGSSISRYTGSEINPFFKEAMQLRSVASPSMKAMYTSFADNPDKNLEKLVEKLAEVDTMAGVEGLWGGAIDDPVAVVYSHPKVASKYYEKKLNGEVVRGDELELAASLKPRQVELILGAEYASRFVNDPVKFFDQASPELQRILTQFVKEVRNDHR